MHEPETIAPGSPIVPAAGQGFEIAEAAAFRELQAFQLSEGDYRVKHSRPVDFSHLRSASAEVMRRELAELDAWHSWYHRIELPHGIVTRSQHSPRTLLQVMGVLEHVPGRSVLDVGTWDGGFAFECERVGAARVVGLDVDNPLELDLGRGYAYCYWVKRYLEAKRQGEETQWRFLNKQAFGFRFAHACLESRVERVHDTVYNLSPARVGRFDITLFCGILYHLRSPLRALDALFSVTDDRTFIETEVSLDEDLGPNGCAFYEKAYKGDVTNWFVPTPRCVVDLLLSAGYRRVQFIALAGSRAFLEAQV